MSYLVQPASHTRNCLLTLNFEGYLLSWLDPAHPLRKQMRSLLCAAQNPAQIVLMNALPLMAPAVRSPDLSSVTLPLLICSFLPKCSGWDSQVTPGEQPEKQHELQPSDQGAWFPQEKMHFHKGEPVQWLSLWTTGVLSTACKNSSLILG